MILNHSASLRIAFDFHTLPFDFAFRRLTGSIRIYWFLIAAILFIVLQLIREFIMMMHAPSQTEHVKLKCLIKNGNIVGYHDLLFILCPQQRLVCHIELMSWI